MTEDSDNKLNSDEHKVVHHTHKVEVANHVKPKKRRITISFAPWQAVSAILFILLVGSLLTGGFGLGSKSDVVAPTNPSAPTRLDVSLDNDAVLGDSNAPVTIIEFSDYECPYCGRFWQQTLPELKTNYINTGKVKFVYRDFPLTSLHSDALHAAIAAECVREQGGDVAYFEYHDKLFSSQPELSDANLKSWAKDFGYDIDSCLDSNKYKDEVEKDLADGSNVGVRGTPAFFIGNEDDGFLLVSGAQPFVVFKSVIDAELA